MLRVEGRKGEWNEFVEFRLAPHQPKFLAQRTGERDFPPERDWFVYRCYPKGKGKVGSVVTIAANISKAEAEERAQNEAIYYAEAGGLAKAKVGSKAELEAAVKGLRNAFAHRREETVSRSGAGVLQSDIRRAMIAVGELPRPRKAKGAAAPRLSR